MSGRHLEKRPNLPKHVRDATPGLCAGNAGSILTGSAAERMQDNSLRRQKPGFQNSDFPESPERRRPDTTDKTE